MNLQSVYEQTLINPTSKRKDDTANLDTTVSPTSSTGTVSKSRKHQQDLKSSKDHKSSTDPKDAKVQNTDQVNLLLNLLGLTNNFFGSILIYI